MTMMTSAAFRAGEEETRISLSDQAPGVDPSLTPPGGCGSGEVGWEVCVGGAHFSSDTAIGPRPDGRRFITSSALLPSLFRPHTHPSPPMLDPVLSPRRLLGRGGEGGGSGAVGVGRTDCTGRNVSRGD